MKTFKLSLLFLLIPFISKGQCEDDFVSVIAVVSQTNLESNFIGVLEISSVTNEPQLQPTQIEMFPVMSYQACVNPDAFGFTVFITELDTIPFEGTINMYLDDGNGNADTDNILTQGGINGTEVFFTLTALEQGCTNPIALNFNPDALIDDFSCEIEGCMDGTAFNYNPNATIDNGSCSGPIYGCIDNGNMTNGMGEINDLDGDGLPAFNYDPLANINDSSCVPIIEACLDYNACNYNVAGNTSDTSCVFLPDSNLCAYCSGENDGSGTIVNNDDDGDGICNNDEILGCTNPIALNFNPNATDNNGSCVFAEFQGCIDSIACNFDSNATITNNNCFYAVDECDICSGETDGTGIVIDNDQDSDGICDADEISGCTDDTANNFNEQATEDDDSCTYDVLGCMDPLACNYDLLANTDDGTCDYAETYFDCNDNCLNDIDGDGICDQNEFEGCTAGPDNDDGVACNFNPFVTDDDGSCEWTSCYGCTDPSACNYNINAYFSTNTCIFASNDCASCSGEQDGSGVILENDDDLDGVCNSDEIVGCIDASACNYDSTPTTDADNSLCNYSTDLDECATCSGEQDGTGIIINNDFDGDGVCNSDEIVGCTDSIACNYNPLTTDEGECNFALEYYDCNGNCLNDIDDNLICDEFQVEGCTDQDACNWDSDANVNDGSCDFPEEYYDCSGNCINDSDSNGICDELEVSGCTDSEACNYNANATMDNGTCEYLEVTLEYNNLSSSLEAISNASLATYQWNVNGEITNINSNRLNPFINGLYTVNVYDEENDCWGEASYTINDVSVNEVSSEIKIFPNPVHNTLYIKSKLNNQNTKIEVYNYLGKLLNANQNKIAQHMQIDVSKLSSGIYIIKLKSEDFISQKEFIKY